MQKFETKKLFYNKYLYGLSFRNPLVSIFRNKNFRYAKSVIDDLQRSHEAGMPLWLKTMRREKQVKQDDFTAIRTLFNECTSYTNDYTLRIEGSILKIYSNDKSWIKSLIKKFDCITEFYQPDPKFAQFLIDNHNTIIVDGDCPHEYKITFGNNTLPTALADWCDRNSNKVKITSDTKDEIRRNGYVAGRYMYVKNDSTLMLCNLIAGTSFARIDKLVSRQNIDK